MWGSEAADQSQSEWSEDHKDDPCHSHTYPRQGLKFPRKHSGWKLKSNPKVRSAVDCRITSWGNVREETVVGNDAEVNQAAMETWQCWWVLLGAGAFTIVSLSAYANTGRWTIEKNPSEGSPLSAQMSWATEKEPTQRRPLIASKRGPMEKDQKTSFLINSCQRLERYWQGHNSCGWGNLCPYILGVARRVYSPRFCLITTKIWSDRH